MWNAGSWQRLILARVDFCAELTSNVQRHAANVRLDKKGVQLGFTIPSRLYRRKAYCCAANRHEYPSGRDLFQWEINRIGLASRQSGSP